MRTLLLILFCFTATAQKDLRMAFSQYSHLGINGSVKSITIYKYIKPDYDTDDKKNTTGTLYSTIKKEYNTEGYLIKDSIASVINRKKSVIGYCIYYQYTNETTGAPIILQTTDFGCIPPYNNKAIKEAVIMFEEMNDSTVNIRTYSKNENGIHHLPQATFLLFFQDTLIVHSESDYYHYKGIRLSEQSARYRYDEYGNFTHTIERSGNDKIKTIRHEVLTIDDYGNATMMLNFINDAVVPEFITRYEIEYYE